MFQAVTGYRCPFLTFTLPSLAFHQSCRLIALTFWLIELQTPIALGGQFLTLREISASLSARLLIAAAHRFAPGDW